MYLISEDSNVIINVNNVFQFSIEKVSCDNCADFRCTDRHEDYYEICCVPVGTGDAYNLGKYSTAEYAENALCLALAELEVKKESFVTIKDEDGIKKINLEKKKLEATRKVQSYKLDPEKFSKK